VVELVDFWVAVEFLGVGAIQVIVNLCCPNSEYGQSPGAGTRSGRSLIPGP
jgi:hypothetical protein